MQNKISFDQYRGMTTSEIARFLMKAGGDSLLYDYMGAVRGPDRDAPHLKSIFTGFLRGIYPQGAGIGLFKLEIKRKGIVDDLMRETILWGRSDIDGFTHYGSHVRRGLSAILRVADDRFSILVQKMLELARALGGLAWSAHCNDDVGREVRRRRREVIGEIIKDIVEKVRANLKENKGGRDDDRGSGRQ